MCVFARAALSARGAFLQKTWEISRKINSARGRNIWGPPHSPHLPELLLFLLFSISAATCSVRREGESVRECTGYWQCFDTRLGRNGIWCWHIGSQYYLATTTTLSTLLGIKFRLLNIDGRRRQSVSAGEKKKLYHLLSVRACNA